MKIGITTLSLNDKDFQEQLCSMLKNNVKPDFIILHYAGFFNQILKGIGFLNKTIKQFRFKSIFFLLMYAKKNKKKALSNFTLSLEEIQKLNQFLKEVQLIKAKGINDRSTISKMKKIGVVVIVANSGILKQAVLSIPNVFFLIFTLQNYHNIEV